MKNLILIFLLFHPLFAIDYLSLMEHYQLGPLGNYKEGEIEIVLDQIRIEEIERRQVQRLMHKGMSDYEAKKSARVGIVSDDMYWIWMRDAVIFPSGATGTYDRLIWKSSLEGHPGVAILGVRKDGRLLLILNYRHATRSWELELPRGKRENNENCEDAAKRELMEETGCSVKSLEFLGVVAPDTGCVNSTVPVYLGYIDKVGESIPEESEAIAHNVYLTFEELKRALKKGEIEIAGKKIPVRDSFITYALFQAEDFLRDCPKID